MKMRNWIILSLLAVNFALSAALLSHSFRGKPNDDCRCAADTQPGGRRALAMYCKTYVDLPKETSKRNLFLEGRDF